MAWRVGAVAIAALAASHVAAPAAALRDQPAIESDVTFTVNYFKGFLKSCVKEVHGDPDIGKIACSCAATVIADRFTIAELTKMHADGVEAFDKVRPGTTKLIEVCVRAAAAAVSR